MAMRMNVARKTLRTQTLTESAISINFKDPPTSVPCSIINKIRQGIGSIKSVTSKGVLRRSYPKRMIVPWYKLFEATIQNQAFISSLCRDGRLQT
jgi:hypothetical protein